MHVACVNRFSMLPTCSVDAKLGTGKSQHLKKHMEKKSREVQVAAVCAAQI